MSWIETTITAAGPLFGLYLGYLISRKITDKQHKNELERMSTQHQFEIEKLHYQKRLDVLLKDAVEMAEYIREIIESTNWKVNSANTFLDMDLEYSREPATEAFGSVFRASRDFLPLFRSSKYKTLLPKGLIHNIREYYDQIHGIHYYVYMNVLNPVKRSDKHVAKAKEMTKAIVTLGESIIDELDDSFSMNI